MVKVMALHHAWSAREEDYVLLPEETELLWEGGEESIPPSYKEGTATCRMHHDCLRTVRFYVRQPDGSLTRRTT